MDKDEKSSILKSLRFKLFLILLFGITATVLLLLYIEVTTSEKELRKDLQENLTNIASTIYTILENTMAQGRKDEVVKNLRHLTDVSPVVKEIRLLDNKKSVKFETSKAIYTPGNLKRLSYPIMARPVCHKCHGQKKLIGFLEVGFDITREKNRMTSMFKRYFISYWILLILITSYVFVTLEKGIFRRLDEVGDAMKAVARGDFQKRIPVKGNDEIARIAKIFNRMSQNIYEINNRLHMFSTFTFLVYQQKTEDYVLELTLDYLNNIFPVYHAEISIRRGEEEIVKKTPGNGNYKENYEEAIVINNKNMGTIRLSGNMGLTENELSIFKLMAVAVSRAIERIRDYEQVTELQENLLHLERLSTAGVMLGSILHEINNPLSGVVGFSELLLYEPHDEKAVKEYAKKILEAATRISMTINNMLKFLRKGGREERISVDLNEIVKIVLKLKEVDLRKKNIKVLTELSEGPVFAHVIPNQIEQALLNIINNAEYAMFKAHSGGTLRIETRHAKQHAQILISDNGPGMPEDVIKNIFNFFFTTKPPGEGTGLGMPIVKRIIDNHNGAIRVESKAGQGSTFIISLPVIV
ncbi:MAG: HAMP domain-containing protein [Nitrospirae bacterium]|nr:HAMP domain-containing protein [Nitrospirota bacterium]